MAVASSRFFSHDSAAEFYRPFTSQIAVLPYTGLMDEKANRRLPPGSLPFHRHTNGSVSEFEEFMFYCGAGGFDRRN